MSELAREHIAQAREHNSESQKALNGAGDDTQAVLSLLEEAKQKLEEARDALETVVTTTGTASSEGKTAGDGIQEAQETVDLTELENAASLVAHVQDTADNMRASAGEAGDELGKVLEAIEDLGNVVVGINRAGDEAQMSTGSAEENLKQAQERLTS